MCARSVRDSARWRPRRTGWSSREPAGGWGRGGAGEGAGGWLAPIGPRRTMANLARALAVPVLVVVGIRLGCLNHAQLTRLAIEAPRGSLRRWGGEGPSPGQ